jgi:hypothetical protein
MQTKVMRLQWFLMMALLAVTVRGGMITPTEDIHRQLLTPQEVDKLLSHQHDTKHPPPPLQQHHHHPQVESNEAMHLTHAEEYDKLRQEVFEEMEHRGKDVVLDSSALVANNTNVPKSKTGSSPKKDKATLKPDATTPTQTGTRTPKGAKGSAPPQAPPDQASTSPNVTTKPPSKASSTKKPKSSYAPETSAPFPKATKAPKETKTPKTTKAPKSPKGGKKQSMPPDVDGTPAPSTTTNTTNDQMRMGDGMDDPGFGVVRDTQTPTMDSSASWTPQPVGGDDTDDSSQLQGENENGQMTVINPPSK